MNAQQWSLVVREHTPLVWKTVYRLLPHHADAADAFQETFLAAWGFAQRREVRNWPGLLQRLATVRAIDLLRRRARRRKRHQGGPDFGQLPAATATPSAQAESGELAEQLRLALAELSPLLSQTYCLRHLNDFSYEQIAEELGISVSAVGTNLHRATQRLRAALAPIVSDDVRGDL